MLIHDNIIPQRIHCWTPKYITCDNTFVNISSVAHIITYSRIYRTYSSEMFPAYNPILYMVGNLTQSYHSLINTIPDWLVQLWWMPPPHETIKNMCYKQACDAIKQKLEKNINTLFHFHCMSPQSYIMLKTPSKLKIRFQRYSYFSNVLNNKIQTKLNTIIGSILKSILNEFRLILLDHITYVIQWNTNIFKCMGLQKVWNPFMKCSILQMNCLRTLRIQLLV